MKHVACNLPFLLDIVSKFCPSYLKITSIPKKCVKGRSSLAGSLHHHNSFMKF